MTTQLFSFIPETAYIHPVTFDCDNKVEDEFGTNYYFLINGENPQYFARTTKEADGALSLEYIGRFKTLISDDVHRIDKQNDLFITLCAKLQSLFTYAENVSNGKKKKFFEIEIAEVIATLNESRDVPLLIITDLDFQEMPEFQFQAFVLYQRYEKTRFIDSISITVNGFVLEIQIDHADFMAHQTGYITCLISNGDFELTLVNTSIYDIVYDAVSLTLAYKSSKRVRMLSDNNGYSGRITCVYHDNCADGISAAWVVRKYYGADNVDFIPASYQTDLPDNLSEELVVIVDFSYPREQILELSKRTKHVILIDHHATAKRRLVDLPDNVEVIFDMNKSGGVLTWEYFYPMDRVPLPIFYIGDRDTWSFTDPSSRSFTMSFFQRGITFETMDQAMHHLDSFMRDGDLLLERQLSSARNIIQDNSLKLWVRGYGTVTLVNCPYSYASDIGDMLSTVNDFSGSFYVGRRGYKFSLRSKKNGIDVSRIAERFGGGGHPSAAGFYVPFRDVKIVKGVCFINEHRIKKFFISLWKTIF